MRMDRLKRLFLAVFLVSALAAAAGCGESSNSGSFQPGGSGASGAGGAIGGGAGGGAGGASGGGAGAGEGGASGSAGGGAGDGDPCRELWVDCPGVVSDYRVCAGASDLDEETAGGVRYFSYYNCALGRRTQTLNIPAECALVWK